METDEASVQPGPMPELLGAVESRTHDTVSAEGMLSQEGSGKRNANQRGPLPKTFSFETWPLNRYTPASERDRPLFERGLYSRQCNSLTTLCYTKHCGIVQW